MSAGPTRKNFTCPSCGQVYQIPVNAPVPGLCPKCAGASASIVDVLERQEKLLRNISQSATLWRYIYVWIPLAVLVTYVLVVICAGFMK